MSIAQPRLSGNCLFASAAYNATARPSSPSRF